MIRKISASLMALALAGCVNLAPDHERPALASAPAYDPEFRPDGTVVASTLSYREWFSDPRLVSNFFKAAGKHHQRQFLWTFGLSVHGSTGP